MATVTPNYSWPVPTSTDLVKDGATAIEALGDAIDATVFGLPTAALTLISSTTIGSAVASVSVNDCFSATYTNYLAIVNVNSNSSTDPMYMRMRVSGADSSASSYQYAGDNTPGGYDQYTQATYGTTAFVWHRYGSGGQSAHIHFFSPFATNNTGFNSISNGLGTNARKNTAGGYFDATTSFTGFTIYPASSTMTGGTIKVYGYKN